MSPHRIVILLLGPIPLVCGSMWLSQWARSGQSLIQPNEVVASEAGGEANRPSRQHQVQTATGDSAAAASANSALAAACRAQALHLRGQLGDECRVIERPPLVIAGDLSQQQLEQWYRDTIQPAAQAMATSYFRTPPDRPISVLLFANATSYDYYADSLYGERGVSVYGYYKPGRATLLMNIDTGGGTLVHELTHALISFDFPAVPDWLNEGLASLHEQCRFRRSAEGPWIEGLVNWRLAILQDEIRSGRARSIAELVRDEQFRGPRESANYAHARYFCMYLQQQGLLPKFYHRFRGSQQRDPTGEQALASVIGQQKWERIDADFRAWVMELQRP